MLIVVSVKIGHYFWRRVYEPAREYPKEQWTVSQQTEQAGRVYKSNCQGILGVLYAWLIP